MIIVKNRHNWFWAFNRAKKKQSVEYSINIESCQKKTRVPFLTPNILFLCCVRIFKNGTSLAQTIGRPSYGSRLITLCNFFLQRLEPEFSWQMLRKRIMKKDNNSNRDEGFFSYYILMCILRITYVISCCSLFTEQTLTNLEY